MPTYRIPATVQVYVNAEDARLALAVLDDPNCLDSFQLEKITGWDAIGEPEEVK